MLLHIFPFLSNLCRNFQGINNNFPRLVSSQFLDLRGNLGIPKEKPTCFSREKKLLAPRIYQAKFCQAAFL